MGKSLDKGVLHVVTAVNNKNKHSPTAMAVIHALNPLLPMSNSQGLLSASDVAGLPVVDYTRHDGSWKAFNGDGQRLDGIKPQSTTADQLLAFAKQKLSAKPGPVRDR